jgi:hypothetical protein
MSRRGAGIAGRAGEVAAVGDLYEAEAGVLLMIGTDTTIIWTAEFCLRMWLQRILTRLIVVADLLVVFYIRRDEYLLETMLTAGFSHVDIVLLEDDLGADLLVAGRAEADGMIVVYVVSCGGHDAVFMVERVYWV